MKTSKLLLLLVTAGILVSTYFLFFRSGRGPGDLGPGDTQTIEKPDDLGGSLEADGQVGVSKGQKAGKAGEAGERSERTPSQGRTKAQGGGASLALQLFLGGKPLAGAKLRLRRVSGGGRWKETTDSTGRLRFAGLLPGHYVIQTDDERVPKSFRIGPHRLRSKQALDLGRVDVPPAAALKFRLLQPDGRPQADTKLTLYHEGSFGLRGVGVPGKTDGEGKGIFVGLSDGDWTLSVVTKKYPVLEKSVSLGSGENLDLGDLTLERGFFVLGRVVDEQGKGIPGARLTPSLHKESRGMKIETYDQRSAVQTDDKGRFRLVTGVKKGRLRVRKEGYLPKSVSYQFKDGELRIVLSRTFGISGKVLGAIPGKTVVFAHGVGAEVKANGGMGGRWKRASVGAKGEFILEKLPPGEYGVMAYTEGKGASIEQRLRLLPRASKRLDLVLKPGGKLDVQVVTPGGKPLPEVSLNLMYRSPFSPESQWEPEVLAMFLSQAKPPSMHFKTNTQGRASFKGLWKGKALLILKGKGLSEKIVSPVLLQGGNQVLRVEMEGAARIVGKAFGPNGKPMIGAKVSVDPVKAPGNQVRMVFSSGGDGSQRTVQADGSFHIEGIKPGRYTVSLKPPLDKTGAFFFDGSEPSLDQKVITLGSGEEAKVTLRARPQWTIQGRVLFQGEPVGGATVSMKQANPPRGFSFPNNKKTDADGKFRFDWVGKGKYFLRATPPEKGVRTPRQTLELPAGGGLRTLDIALGGGLVKGRIANEGDRPEGLELLLVPKSEAKTGSTQIAMIRISTNDGGGQEQNMVLGDGPSPVVPKKDGSFAFHFVTQGEWILKIRAGGAREKTTLKSLPLSLAKNQGLDLGDISLEKTYPVQLLVKDQGGKVVELASVKIFALKDGKAADTPVFRGMIHKGKAKVPGLRVGSYKLVLRRISLGATPAAKAMPPQEGKLEVLPGGKIRGSELRVR